MRIVGRQMPKVPTALIDNSPPRRTTFLRGHGDLAEASQRCLTVRPPLPVGVDHLTLDHRGREGAPGPGRLENHVARLPQPHPARGPGTERGVPGQDGQGPGARSGWSPRRSPHTQSMPNRDNPTDTAQCCRKAATPAPSRARALCWLGLGWLGLCADLVNRSALLELEVALFLENDRVRTPRGPQAVMGSGGPVRPAG